MHYVILVNCYTWVQLKYGRGLVCAGIEGNIFFSLLELMGMLCDGEGVDKQQSNEKVVD